MKIKKIEDVKVYHREATELIYEVNGKEIHVSSWFVDDQYGGEVDGGVEILERDRELLSEEELEEFEDLIQDEALGYEIGKEVNTN